jgi:hypothetical protein
MGNSLGCQQSFGGEQGRCHSGVDIRSRCLHYKRGADSDLDANELQERHKVRGPMNVRNFH